MLYDVSMQVEIVLVVQTCLYWGKSAENLQHLAEHEKIKPEDDGTSQIRDSRIENVNT